MALANIGAHCNLSGALKVISFEHFAPHWWNYWVIVGAESKRRHLLRFAFEKNQLAVIHSVPLCRQWKYRSYGSRCEVRDTGLMRLCGWIPACVCVGDWVALNLLRRPLITVYPHNLSAITHFLWCVRLCAYSTSTCKLPTCMYITTPACARSALLFNERKWWEKNSDHYIPSPHTHNAQLLSGRESLITDRDRQTERKENMWAADETEKMRERTEAEMDDSFY